MFHTDDSGYNHYPIIQQYYRELRASFPIRLTDEQLPARYLTSDPAFLTLCLKLFIIISKNRPVEQQ